MWNEYRGGEEGTEASSYGYSHQEWTTSGTNIMQEHVHYTISTSYSLPSLLPPSLHPFHHSLITTKPLWFTHTHTHTHTDTQTHRHTHTHTHLNLLEVHWFLDDLVVLRQFLSGWKDHEDVADLSSTAILVVDYQLPQLDHHSSQFRGVWNNRWAGYEIRMTVANGGVIFNMEG